MAEKKRNINPEQFNEFLTYVATKVEPTQIEDIFTGKAFKETIDMFKEDNPLIKSYQLTGAGFINKLLKDKTDFNLTNDDKKLIIEVGAFGNPDPRSGFKLNMSDPKIQDKVEKMSEDLVKQKQNLSNDEYEIYRANARKKLVNDVLKFKVTDTVFDNEAPKLDVSERDRSKPFSDFITKELNMQSRYGFNPKIPDFAGGTVGKEYIPANDQERYRTKTITSEYFPDETTRRDRLENFYPDKESGYLRGPEGLFYNPEAEKFLRQKDVYGPTPQLQGYQYDPRLKGILSTAVNPNYGSQFKEGGKTMDIKQQTKNVAAQGRYGDSMLLHVNPAEVKGLASAMPITVNPETGQPEAFLPFLAPLLGSVFGPTLFASLGATGALTGLAGSALGSGLAQYAATGDLKKGLLAGLTGYGVGTALQTASGAAGASAATQAATDAATTAGTLGNVGTQKAIQSAATQAGGEALKTASTFAPATATTAVTGTPLSNLKSVFNPAAITETTAAAAPDLLTSSVGTTVDPTLGTSFGNLATGLADPMAYIPAGIGMGGTGIMESQEAFERMIGESEEEYRRRREAMYRNNPEPILYSAEGGPTGYFMGGDVRRMAEAKLDNITGGELPQIYAPARQPYQVNPNFMPGFSPETMYFEPSTISAPASGLQAGAPPVTVDTYEGSKGGYGGRQAYIAPQVSIDPYTAYTGEAPEGLKFGKQPRPVFEGPELPDQGLVNPGLPDFDGPVGLGGRIGIPNIGNLDIQSIIDSLDQYNIPEREIGLGEYMPITGQDLGITPPRTLGEPLPLGVDNQIDISQYLGNRENNLESLQDIFGPQVRFATGLEPNTDSGMGLGLGEMMTAEELIARGGTPQPRGLGIFGKGPIIEPDLLMENENYMFEPPIRDRKEGGDTLKAIPEDNKGLPNLPEDVRNEMGYKQAGGMTDIQNDPLTKEVTMFILGETDNEQALNDFITKYGSDAFMQLREAVLQSIVPNAQTQGLIKGDGEGGMDDDLRGMIGDKERIAVSQDEFIVPADVVSMLGDGSSDAGSKELYDMMDRVRKEKTGTTKQAPRLANAGGLLPA